MKAEKIKEYQYLMASKGIEMSLEEATVVLKEVKKLRKFAKTSSVETIWNALEEYKRQYPDDENGLELLEELIFYTKEM